MDLFFFIREVEEDQQLNEMMKNLGKHPSGSIIPTSLLHHSNMLTHLCVGQE